MERGSEAALSLSTIEVISKELGVDVSALLIYGGRIKDLNNVEIDDVIESENWEGDNFEEWDVEYTDAYNGPCEWTTIIGVCCKYQIFLIQCIQIWLEMSFCLF